MNILFWDHFPDWVLLLLMEETEKLYPKQMQRYIEIVKISNGIMFNHNREQPGKTQIYSCVILSILYINFVLKKFY